MMGEPVLGLLLQRLRMAKERTEDKIGHKDELEILEVCDERSPCQKNKN